jgi:AcrR family transcriptional regulator
MLGVTLTPWCPMPDAVADRPETQLAMLEAAKAALRKRGFAGLSTREVAAAAGVPLSQIHYHFGSKQGLVLALFEHLNEQLLERQEHLFGDPSLKLSEQWDRACDYLDEDIASGYVRVMHELSAAGWSDPEVARAMRGAILGWIRLVTAVAQRVEARFGGFAPFSADEVGALVSNAFVGAESLILLGIERNKIPIRQSLRRVGDLIRLLEGKAR